VASPGKLYRVELVMNFVNRLEARASSYLFLLEMCRGRAVALLKPKARMTKKSLISMAMISLLLYLRTATIPPTTATRRKTISGLPCIAPDSAT
jgi:hypothetical protein